MSGASGIFDSRRNNLDFVRLWLSVLVILSHSFPLATGTERNEPFILATHGQTSGGTIAVDLFFVLSGFLIANSYLSSSSLWSYLGKRIRRIYPGFIAAMLVGALLVAPLASASSPFHTASAQLGHFVLSCVRLREFDYRHAFASNPAPGAINGSTWSISYEFCCYLGVAVLGLAGILTRRRVVLGIFGLSLVVSFLFEFTGWAPAGSFLGPILGYPPFWARLLPMYLAGVVFFPQPRSHPSSWIHRSRCAWDSCRRGVHPTGLDGMFPAGWHLPAVLVRLSSGNPSCELRQARRFLLRHLLVRLSHSATGNAIRRTSYQPVFAIWHRSSADTGGSVCELAFDRKTIR